MSTRARPARKAAKRPAARADLGAPIDGFLAKQPPPLRAIVDELRAMIGKAAPEARASIKWGMPFFEVGSSMMCAVGAHRAHVNLILPGPAGTYADPAGLLVGEGKTGKHLKLTSVDDLPRREVAAWLRTAAGRARTGGKMR
jgi:hypothetical protein